MALFGKSEEKKAEPTPSPSGPPTDMVLKMRNQGYSNNQIVQTLQREGYKSHDIFDAMNQADIKGSVAPMQPGQVENMSSPENPMQPQQQESGVSEEVNRATETPAEAPPSFAPQQRNVGGPDRELIQEVAETIIEEKWEELVKDIKSVVEWKESTETKISQLEQKFTDLKDNFDNLHKGIVGKIGEYDESLSNVGTEIKALEKVFQKILPTLTENVNELSRITKGMKEKK